MSTSKNLLDGVSREIDDEDFTRFKEGDIFTPLGKKIGILAVQQRDYIVFLDDRSFVHWYYNAHYAQNDFEKIVDYGEVVSRQANLEATSILLLVEPQLEVFRRLLAEAIGRLLDDKKSENAQAVLDKAELFLRARSREKAKMWYLSATLVATLVALTFGLLLWIYRQQVLAVLGVAEVGLIEVMLGAAMGSFGALISVLLRSDEIKIDFSARRPVHYFEGVMRTLVGAAAGFLFALAIKSNIFLGAVNQSERALIILLVVSIIAGASERLLPDLIKQIEGTLVRNVEEVDVASTDDNQKEENQKEPSKGRQKKPRRMLFLRKQ